jgi:hypothetical protein
MSRTRTRRFGGHGTAWLVFNDATNDYLCYWYRGANGADRLVEHGHATSAARAVAWGRARTPWIRIRMGDAKTYWAGNSAAPEGFAGLWSEDPPMDEGVATGVGAKPGLSLRGLSVRG